MTAFGKLIRTTAFRLTLVYLFLFAFFAASLLAYFAWNTRRLITEQITTTVNAETSEINDIYDRRGLHALAFTIANRALRPGANLYLLTTPTGQAIGGNVDSLAPGVMATLGWSETAYRRLDDQDTGDHRALVRHGIDQRFSAAGRPRSGGTPAAVPIVAKAAQWSILVVIVLGSAAASRRAAGAAADRRHDRHHPAHHGRRSLGRLPVGRSGDGSIVWRKTSTPCWSGSRR